MKYVINTSVRKSAKDIYDKLPARQKGEWLSDAIEEKHNREQYQIFTEEQQKYIQQIEQRVEALERILFK